MIPGFGWSGVDRRSFEAVIRVRDGVVVGALHGHRSGSFLLGYLDERGEWINEMIVGIARDGRRRNRQVYFCPRLSTARWLLDSYGLSSWCLNSTDGFHLGRHALLEQNFLEISDPLIEVALSSLVCSDCVAKRDTLALQRSIGFLELIDVVCATF